MINYDQKKIKSAEISGSFFEIHQKAPKLPYGVELFRIGCYGDPNRRELGLQLDSLEQITYSVGKISKI